MDLVEAFLRSSVTDIEASKVLFRRRLYASSVFHLQQAVEKGLKAAFIFAGVIPKDKKELSKWLRKKLGHYIVENLGKVAREVFFRKIGLANSLVGNSLSLIQRQLDSMVNEFENEVKRRFYVLDLTNRKAVEKLVNWAVQSSSESSLRDKWEEEMHKIPLISKLMPLFGKYLQPLFRFIFQMVRLCILGLVLERYEIVSRYPSVENKFLGPQMFSEKYPLVKRLGELQMIAEETIRELSKQISILAKVRYLNGFHFARSYK